MPFSAKIKTIGYGVSTVSVALLAVISWKNAKTDPWLAAILFAGVLTSVSGMGLRWWSYEIEEDEKQDD